MGQNTQQHKVPSIGNLHIYFSQKLYLLIIPDSATIVTLNNYYKKILLKRGVKAEIYVLPIYAGGAANASTASLNSFHRDYDLLWVGRFHAQKGLTEIPGIVKLIKSRKSDIKVAVLGDGNSRLKRKLIKLVNKYNLQENIELKGFLLSEERNKYYRNSKILLMTSYYESFGQVNIEAMKYGLPVVAYDQPVYGVFSKGMIKVPMLDRQQIANEVINLLTNKKLLTQLSSEAVKFSQDFTWRNAGTYMYKLLLRKSTE